MERYFDAHVYFANCHPPAQLPPGGGNYDNPRDNRVKFGPTANDDMCMLLGVRCAPMWRPKHYAALALALGCSSGGDDSGSNTDAGPIAHREDSGTGRSPAAGSPAPAPAPTPLATLPRGTCGVLRRITVPRHLYNAVRVPHAFAVVDESVRVGSPAWRVVSDDGAHQAAFTSMTMQRSTIALLPIGADPFEGSAVLLSWAERSTDGMNQLTTEVVHDAAQPGTAQIVGAAFERGTSVQANAVSLDGTRAVFLSGHVATDDPHGFLLDAAGARVGDVVSLIDTGNHPNFDCLAATATEHGGAISVTTTTDSTWQLVELAADGGVVQRVTMDATEIAGCPQVQLSREGLMVVVRELAGRAKAYTARDGALLPIDVGITLLRPEWLPWVGELEPGRWLVMQADMDGDTQIGQRAPDGSFQLIAGDLPELRGVIPSEPGRLFAIEAVDEMVPDHSDILELGCAPE